VGDRKLVETREEDAAVEAAVLRQALAVHPTALTQVELGRELGADGGDFAAHDAIERAVRDLVGAGLLHRQGELLLPTRAALRLVELLER
jgi:hypothetical protein